MPTMPDDAPTTPAPVLLVEDNFYMREEMGALLEDEGHAVIACDSSEAALEAVQSLPGGVAALGVLVTDIDLPGLPGTELARRLLAERPTLPVILCTGHDSEALARALGPQVRLLPKDEACDRLLPLVEEVRAATPD